MTTDKPIKSDTVAPNTPAATDTNNDKSTQNEKIVKSYKKNATREMVNINYEQPGRLINKANLSLNTYDAQRLFLGFYKSKGIGLVNFAQRMALVWSAAANDDPYADWTLLRVFDSIKKCRNQLTALTKKYEKQFVDAHMQTNLTVAPFESSKPLTQELTFTTPYGYLGAGLIADFDNLMRVVLTAYRVGILFNQSHTQIYDEWIQKIHLIFKLPYKWKAKRTTRQDVVDDTDKNKDLRNNMGKIPQGIVDKTLRSPFSPFIREKKRVEKH